MSSYATVVDDDTSDVKCQRAADDQNEPPGNESNHVEEDFTSDDAENQQPTAASSTVACADAPVCAAAPANDAAAANVPALISDAALVDEPALINTSALVSEAAFVSVCVDANVRRPKDATAERVVRLETVPPDASGVSSCRKPVFGVAFLGDRLYTIQRQSNSVLVYEIVEDIETDLHAPRKTSFERKTDVIVVDGMKDPWDIAGCPVRGCLYIADLAGGCVWRVMIPTLNGTDKCAYRVERWLDGIDRPWTVSVGRPPRVVLVTGTGNVTIYRPDASPIAAVRHPAELPTPSVGRAVPRYPLHVIEAVDGVQDDDHLSLAMGHGLLDGTPHGVCQFDLATTSHDQAVATIKSETEVSCCATPHATVRYAADVAVREPWHLAVVPPTSVTADDENDGGIFVADFRNNRVLLLDRRLRRCRLTIDVVPNALDKDSVKTPNADTSRCNGNGLNGLVAEFLGVLTRGSDALRMRPWRLSYNSNRRLLAVGLYNGQVDIYRLGSDC